MKTCAWCLQRMPPHGGILYEKCVRRFHHGVKVAVCSHVETVRPLTRSLVTNSCCKEVGEEAAALTAWPTVLQ